MSNGNNGNAGSDTKKMTGRQKTGSVAALALYALILGAVSGAIVWAVLWVMDKCIELFWTILFNDTAPTAIYTAAVCVIGGVIIGLFQKKYGLLPDTMEEAMGKLKRDGTYAYDKLYIIAIAALLPLIFGGSLGPEAGLTGLIIGLCCMVGDKLKYKTDEARELAEAGLAATLGVIFNAPFFGFVNNFEHRREDEKRFFSPREFKVAKIVIYAAGIVGGFGAMKGLQTLLGGGLGLPRFKMDGTPGLEDWKWFLVYAGCGILLGLLYLVFGKLSKLLAKPFAKNRVLSCAAGGACLAVLGIWSSLNMFSGESQMGTLIVTWTTIPAATLIITAITKILAINLCLAFGWKGGNIFPIIFCGVSLGYGLAAMTGALPVFAVAVTAAAAYGYIMRKPLTVVAVLFMCFPLRLVIPLAAAAYIGSLVPAPWTKQAKKADSGEAEEEQDRD